MTSPLPTNPAPPASGPAPKVSLCIPVYNGAEHLPAALACASAQTFRDLEILVVDNASTDDTAAIVLQAASQDPRIRLVRNERNLGLIGNFNRGMELARGEWLKFLCHDDLLDPDCIERMLAANTAGNDFIVCGRRGLVEPTADPRQRQFYTSGIVPLQELGLAGNIGPDQVARALAKLSPFYNLFGEPNCWLFRRSRLPEIGTFNPWLVQSCDLEFCLRFAATLPMTVVPEPLVTFRAHGGSTTTGNMARRFEYEFLDPLLLTWLFLHNPRHREFLARHPVVLHRWQEQMHLRRQAMERDPAIRERFAAWLAEHPEAPADLGRLPLAARLRLMASRAYWTLRRIPKTKRP